MAQDQQQATDALYLGNLHPKVTKAVLYDICIQAGPVSRVSLPDSSVDGRPRFGFCHYESVVSAKYAHALFQNTLNLYGYSVRVDYSPQGNPAPSGLQLSTFRKCTLPPQLAFGELSAAGGGTILKRKNRSQDMTMI